MHSNYCTSLKYHTQRGWSMACWKSYRRSTMSRETSRAREEFRCRPEEIWRSKARIVFSPVHLPAQRTWCLQSYASTHNLWLDSANATLRRTSDSLQLRVHRPRNNSRIQKPYVFASKMQHSHLSYSFTTTKHHRSKPRSIHGITSSPSHKFRTT